jgi:4-hydroxy-3-methylbut-2-en-1-yl diphosphate reductase
MGGSPPGYPGMDAMNRSAVQEFLSPGTSVPPGEVLVATQIGDPVRGPLPCPAAPLVGGMLRRKATRVGYAPVGHFADPFHDDDGGAAVFVATCQQRDGRLAAVAAAASAADRFSAAAARSAVDEWSAVFGTRRLLTAASPWCGGAAQALAAARRAVDGRRTVHIYGQLAAHGHAISELAELGAVFVRSLDEIPDGATVLLPAHGVCPGVHAEAEARGLEIIDATCPLVAWVHTEARKFAERGDDLVLIGRADYAAAAGITAQAPGRTTVVSTPGSTAALRVTDPKRVSYLLQPGIPVEDSAPVTAALRSRFPALRGPHPDGFCYAASDRAETIRAVASASDVMLILGSADSPDARKLSGLARDCGARTHVVGETGDILPAMLSGAGAIGMAESTSADPDLAGQVTEALSGLGRLSVTTRHVSTDVVGAPSWRP